MTGACCSHRVPSRPIALLAKKCVDMALYTAHPQASYARSFETQQCTLDYRQHFHGLAPFRRELGGSFRKPIRTSRQSSIAGTRLRCRSCRAELKLSSSKPTTSICPWRSRRRELVGGGLIHWSIDKYRRLRAFTVLARFLSVC